MDRPISTGDGPQMDTPDMRGTGDSWRWRLGGVGRTTISVIDSAEERKEPENAHRVPFGFSRVLHPPPPEPEPMTWEGSD
jgi:hypothetical protein